MYDWEDVGLRATKLDSNMGDLSLTNFRLRGLWKVLSDLNLHLKIDFFLLFLNIRYRLPSWPTKEKN